MKTLFFALFFTLAASVSASLPELDGRQEKLALRYLELKKNIPDVQAAADKGDPAVKEQINAIRAFFKEYDQFNMDKIDVIFEKALLRARAEALEEIKRTGKLPTKAGQALKKLEEKYAEYERRKIFFGTDKDTARLDVGQEVLPAYGDFAKALLKARGQRPWRTFGSAKIVPFVDTVPDFLKVSGKFLKLLWASYFQARTGKQDRAPIPEALAKVQRKLVSMRDIEIKWEGLENIQSLEHDGKTLNMFLINHGNSFLDTSAQQAFPIKGMSSMGDVDIFFPAFLARRMVKSDHMVTVGHGDTTQKAIDLVRSKQLNRFFLAIEGITGTGLYEMRPIMPLFHFAVYDSIQRGLNLMLYPIAFPDNFRLLNDWRSPIEGKRPARGVVLPPLSTATCINLRSLTDSDDAVAQVIRWSWFSTLRNIDDEVLSMPTPSEIESRLERIVWGME